MFAFAIWDRPRRRMFVARDRVGIKPLYWTRAQGGVALGSEIKALFAFPGVERRARPESVVEHLTLRYCAAPRTLFEGIHKLPPGHCADAGARPESGSNAGGGPSSARASTLPRTMRWPRSSRA